MSKQSKIAPEEMRQAGKEPEDLVSHQENLPVPYLAGTRQTALVWLDAATAMLTERAKDAIPSKK
jgi:hypothetical protein